MTRRLPLLFAALALAHPLAAQVGYPPDRSPYEDLRGKQAIVLAPAWLSTTMDPAGVGPEGGMFLTARFEALISGPLWLTARLGYAPGLERTVKDPLFDDAMRFVRTQDEGMVIGDLGFALNLTGNKSYRRVAPRVTGALGFASSTESDYDLGGYRFGTRFTLVYGVGARINTHSAWETTIDLQRVSWQYKYPDAYRGDATTIIGDRQVKGWRGNTLLSIGVVRYFSR